MHGSDIQQDTLFSTVIPGDEVPADHLLCPIREMVNTALKELDADFNALYSYMDGTRSHRRGYSVRPTSAQNKPD